MTGLEMGVEVLGRQMITCSWRWSGRWGGDGSPWNYICECFILTVEKKKGTAGSYKVHFKYRYD